MKNRIGSDLQCNYIPFTTVCISFPPYQKTPVPLTRRSPELGSIHGTEWQNTTPTCLCKLYLLQQLNEPFCQIMHNLARDFGSAADHRLYRERALVPQLALKAVGRMESLVRVPGSGVPARCLCHPSVCHQRGLNMPQQIPQYLPSMVKARLPFSDSADVAVDNIRSWGDGCMISCSGDLGMKI